MADISKSKEWTLEKIQSIANQFTFKGDFFKYGKGAYGAAKRFGVFEQVTAHMKTHKATTLSKERFELTPEVEEAIKKDYVDNNMGLRKIELKYNVTQRVIKEFLVGAGVEIRARRGGNPVKDLTGMRFGKLVVSGRALDSDKFGRAVQWFCVCDCGGTKTVAPVDLKLKRVQSCGCLATTDRPKLLDNEEYRLASEARHKKRIAEFGRVQLVSPWAGDDEHHLYRCLDHEEEHWALPYQVQRGLGLRCCQLERLPSDSVFSLLDGDLRAGEKESILYVFDLERFPGYLKIGITVDLYDRSRASEYGQLLSSWELPSREDAFIIEGAIHSRLAAKQKAPDELAGLWPGHTELFFCTPEEVIHLADELLAEYQRENRWRFMLKHWSMGKEARRQVEQRAKDEP